MTSSNIYDAGIALSCLSNICTHDLARDLAAGNFFFFNIEKLF